MWRIGYLGHERRHGNGKVRIHYERMGNDDPHQPLPRDNEGYVKGAFVSKAEVVEPSDFVISDEGKTMRDKIWSETIDILTKELPQLKSSLQE
ncbi:hypothetical protein F5I97DRAFT_1931101 [Phlebopus sp. FC_14]|nr:hypothetical protein F5I97DRAFT_1931101 [Phlebopus sp. FC_14]